MSIAILDREPPDLGLSGSHGREPPRPHGRYAGGTISRNHWEPPPEAWGAGGVVTVGNHLPQPGSQSYLESPEP